VSKLVHSVERSIDILLSLTSGPRTLTEVVRATNLSKGTAFRLLASLGHENLVVKDPSTNVYMLGPGSLRLIQGITQGIASLAVLAKPSLIRLRELTGETITVHMRVGNERICIEELPSQQPIRYIASVGSAAPLHVGSAGRILVAFLPAAERERVLRNLRLYPVTDRTITDLATLRKELESVRRSGWASSSGERVPGASAISVPIRGPNSVLTALSVLAPSFRLSRGQQIGYLPELKRTAAEIEASVNPAGSDLEEAGA
jgi:DNA-binding IclR family transcriptional regulator